MKIFRFLDKIEDKIRYSLSRHPIVYALISGIAIVLFWRGVWMTADLFSFMTGPVSLIMSLIILTMIGVFVSFFIGEQFIIRALKQKKKIEEKTEAEIRAEEEEHEKMRSVILKILKDLEEIKEQLQKEKAGHSLKPDDQSGPG